MTITGFVGVTGTLSVAREVRIDGFIGVTGTLARPLPVISAPEDAQPSTMAVPRRTVLVDMDGTPLDRGYLATANHGSITWTRSQTTSWSVSLPVDSTDAATVLDSASTQPQSMLIGTDDPFREVQLWRGDKLLTWGPSHTTSVDGETLEVSGGDASWYLGRRGVGPATTVNLLDNGDLANGVSGWFISTFRGWGQPLGGRTGSGWSIKRTRLKSDPRAFGFRIEDTTPVLGDVGDDAWDPANPNLPTFPTAQAFFTIPPQQVGTKLTFSCWIEVEQFRSPNDDKGSIFIGLFPRNARGLEDLITVEFASLDWDHPVGARVRHEATIDVPAGQFTWGVASVRSCKGISYLSDFTLEWDGGLINVNVDKAVIMRRLVDHLSGNPTASWAPARQHPLRPFHGPTSYGKSNVKIATDVPSTPYRLTRIYPFAGGGDGLGPLTELAEDDRASGWRMSNTPTRRYFSTRRNLGVRWDCPMRWVPAGGNLTGFGWQYLGQQAANVVTVQSAYPGSRQQGYAINPNAFANGLTIEEALSAPQDTWDDALQGQATTRLFQTTHAVNLALKLAAEPYLTDLDLMVGQVVPVTIVHGRLRIAGLYRIHSMTLTADDYLELVATPEQVPRVSLT